MKISPGDAFLNVVLEARRFQFSAFSLTLENEKHCGQKSCPGTSKFALLNCSVLVLYYVKNSAWLI